jgi:hypothetical protein
VKVEAKITGTQEVRLTFAELRNNLARKALAATAEDVEEYVVSQAAKHHKTGALVRSVFIRPAGDAWEVGHDLQHAPHTLFVHWGTKPHKIKPKNKRALRWASGGAFAFAREVSHPGNKPDKWMDRTAAMAPDIFQRHVAAQLSKATP